MPEGRSEGVQVKEEPSAVAVRVVTSTSLLGSPVWRMMVQPPSQPEYLISKGLPSSRSQAELRKAGWAATAATRAEMAKTEYFILN